MTEAEQMFLADEEFQRSQALFMTATPLGEVVETAGLQLVNCGAPVAHFNLANLKLPLGDVAAEISRAEAYFAARELPFRLMVRSDHRERVAQRLVEKGYTAVEPTPAMLLRTLPEIPAPPAGLEIRIASEPADVAAFRGVAERGFGMPEGMGTLAVADAVIARPDVDLLLGRVGGEPVATALVRTSVPVGGIYFVACEEAWRRRGYGEALTWAAVAAGAARGARFASLQASQLGAPVYARMGFATPAHYCWFASPGADASEGFEALG